MRLLAAMLLLGLTVPALADEAKVADPKPAKLGLRVVKVMPESHQALLFDKNRGTHVLVEVGKPIEGYMVQEIDDEEVTLVADGASVVLTTPEQTFRRGRELASAKPADPYPPPVVAAPLPAVAAPVDPYGDVPQPIVTAGLRVDPAVAVVSAAPQPTVDAPPVVASPAPLAAPAAPTVPTGDLAVTLVRADFERSLLDFGKLSASARGAFTSAGLRLDKVLETSLYFTVGLRPGDVITTVDGKPLHSIDDAADLYARASGVKAITVQLIRAGKPMTLRVAIQ